MEIRLAGEGDAFAISIVLRKSFAEYESLYTAEAFAVTTPAPEIVLERMSEGPVWICLEGGRVVGTVSAVEKETGLYVRGMAVLPEVRSRGVGSRLLEHVQQYAIGNSIGSLFLSTTPFLDHAIRLYERFGFQRSAAEPHDLCGTPLFTMVKELVVPYSKSEGSRVRSLTGNEPGQGEKPR